MGGKSHTHTHSSQSTLKESWACVQVICINLLFLTGVPSQNLNESCFPHPGPNCVHSPEMRTWKCEMMEGAFRQRLRFYKPAWHRINRWLSRPPFPFQSWLHCRRTSTYTPCTAAHRQTLSSRFLKLVFSLSLPGAAAAAAVLPALQNWDPLLQQETAKTGETWYFHPACCCPRYHKANEEGRACTKTPKTPQIQTNK